MFSLVTTCTPDYRLDNYYTQGDRLSLGIDCLAVAALAALVCIVVVGKIDIGLPGSVGTLHNTSIQAMMGAGAGIVVLDAIAAVVKWNTGKTKTQQQQETRDLIQTWTDKLQSKLSTAGPRYQLEGIRMSPTFGVALRNVEYLIGRQCNAPHMQNGVIFYRTAALAQEVPAEIARKLHHPSTLSDAEVEAIAAYINLTEITCNLTLENFNKILERWFGVANPATEAEFNAAVQWYADKRVSTDPNHWYRARFVPPNCVAYGDHLTALALYHILKKHSYRTPAVEAEVRKHVYLGKGETLEEGIRGFFEARASGGQWTAHIEKQSLDL